MSGGEAVASSAYCAPPSVSRRIRSDSPDVVTGKGIAPNRSARGQPPGVPVDGHGQRPGGRGRHHRGQAHRTRAEDREGVAGAGAEGVSTAPAPVRKPQPSGPSSSTGSAGSTRTALRAGTSAYAANEDWPNQRGASAPPLASVSRGVSSLRPPKRLREAGSRSRRGRAAAVPAVPAGVEAQHDVITDADRGVRSAARSHPRSRLPRGRAPPAAGCGRPAAGPRGSVRQHPRSPRSPPGSRPRRVRCAGSPPRS